MEHCMRIEYIEFEGARFYTVVLLPEQHGCFPTVIYRTPYVQASAALSELEIAQNCLRDFQTWLSRGYAIVYQHCRGQGKSTGEFIPYIHEREDGLALRKWIRTQSFYNGEIFLLGGSYTASLHYCTAPFEADIKGAVLEVQDTERYRLWYRNGQMRKGHANWHFTLYKPKCNLNKNFSMESFSQRPLCGLSDRVLGDRAADFEAMLLAPNPTASFWQTRFGGIEARNATDNTNIPILFTTGYNDYYVGGMFAMWAAMSPATRSQCAMLVSPYNHGDGYHPSCGRAFPKGSRSEQFGSDYPIDWLDHIRLGTPLPYGKGEITYYRTFEDCWHPSFGQQPTIRRTFSLGEGTVSFCYDPLNPPAFSEEGTYAKQYDDRTDVITLYTAPAKENLFVKGRMEATLTVRSDCADTSFYMQISIQKQEGDYVLRHDITSLSYQLGQYTPGSEAVLHFCFDEYAFLLHEGERLRIDLASTDNNTYVCHTNQAGLYCWQSCTKVAVNTVDLGRSELILPTEV